MADRADGSDRYEDLLNEISEVFPELERKREGRSDRDTKRGEVDVPDTEFDPADEDLSYEMMEIRDEHLDVLEELRAIQREVRGVHLKKLDELMARYEEALTSEEDVGCLKEETVDILDNHIDVLEEYAGSKQSGFGSRLTTGVLSLVGGAGVAEVYYPAEDLISFYLSAPDVVAENPYAAALGIGLPAVGVYSLVRSASDKRKESEIRDELSDYRERLRRIEEEY